MLKIIYLGNAGIIVETTGERYIFDGLYSDIGHSFGPMSKKILDFLYDDEMNTKNNFLVFTHFHPDHFSLERVEKFLKIHPTTTLIIPKYNISKKIEYIEKNQEVIYLKPDREINNLKINGDKLYYFATKHDGKSYADIVNMCYLLNIGEKNIWITGDTDYIGEDFNQVIDKKIDLCIVNPLFFNFPRGRRILRELQIKNVIVYHIPLKEYDNYSIRDLVKSDIENHGGYFNITPLTIPGQYMELSKRRW